jgi:hypothetical protein
MTSTSLSVRYLQSDVFAVLPEHLRAEPANRRIWGGMARDSFLEGPTFSSDGALLSVNVPFGQIVSFEREGLRGARL